MYINEFSYCCHWINIRAATDSSISYLDIHLHCTVTNEYLDIRLLSEKCFHNFVKYQILAHHFAVTSCYRCL